MAFDIQVAQRADAPKLADVFFAAFSDEFNRTLFPDKPDARAWMEKNMLSADNMPENAILLKVTDSSNSDGHRVAGFAKWVRPLSTLTADHDRQDVPLPAWPESSDKDLCDLFFGTMDTNHQKYMNGKPHYYLDLLSVHPSYQGRGLASKLLRWGLTRADEEGVEVFLSASPDGRPLYEKHGFQVVGEPFSPYPGYQQVSMIRLSQRK